MNKKRKLILIVTIILVILIIMWMILYFIRPNNDSLIYNLECEEPDKSMIDLNKGGKEFLEYNGKYYLFVKLGKLSTGGYSIKIEDVEVRKNKVEVYVSTKSPGRGELVTEVFTYPYDVVEFNKKPYGINIIYNND